MENMERKDFEEFRKNNPVTNIQECYEYWKAGQIKVLEDMLINIGWIGGENSGGFGVLDEDIKERIEELKNED